MSKLIFYTTLGCHLCEHAEELLLALAEAESFELQAVDISSDAKLVELYGIRIPVVKNADNDTEIGWPFSLEQLQELLQRG